MSNVNLITIKNKQNGFTRTLGEPEFNGMIDKADYEIVVAEKQTEKPKPKPKPKPKSKPKAKKKS
tara:strand:+ start:317 stop:511 length:195 start_codon:yes stop_codon:yes gene_type:complete